MTRNAFFRSTSYILWGLILVWGVVFANNTLYPILASRLPNVHTYVRNDILSDAVMLFVALMPAIRAPQFFGYQIGSISKHRKMLLGMAAFFVADHCCTA